jgi:hypothetical protein
LPDLQENKANHVPENPRGTLAQPLHDLVLVTSQVTNTRRPEKHRRRRQNMDGRVLKNFTAIFSIAVVSCVIMAGALPILLTAIAGYAVGIWFINNKLPS